MRTTLDIDSDVLVAAKALVNTVTTTAIDWSYTVRRSELIQYKMKTV